MKVTDIKVHIIETGLEYSITLHGSHKVQVGIVRIFTDEGIEGNIDYTTPGFPCKLLAQLIVGLKDRIVEEDPLYTEGIWSRLYRTTRFLMPIYALGCIDAALWDIVGKSLNTPVYRLLGGSKDRVRAYASTRTLPDIKGFQKLSESLVEHGFTAIKLHPFGEADRDIELCRAIRQTVGDNIDLMIDPVSAYNREEALRVGQIVDDLNFYWYEEPLPESDLQGYIDLCRQLNVPVIGVDSLNLSLGNYADYLARGAFDMVQTDAARQGITWSRKLAAIAEGFGRRCQGHASGPPLHQAANLHLVASLSNSDFFEMPVPEGLLDTPMKDTIALEPDGYVSLPQKPGLGLELDWEKVAKFTIDVVE